MNFRNYNLKQDIQARLLEGDDIEGFKSKRKVGQDGDVTPRVYDPIRKNIMYILGSKEGGKKRKFYGAPGVDYLCQDNQGNRWIERKYVFESKYAEQNLPQADMSKLNLEGDQFSVVAIVEDIKTALHHLVSEGKTRKENFGSVLRRMNVLREKLRREDEEQFLPLTQEEFNYQFELLKTFLQEDGDITLQSRFLAEMEKEGCRTRRNASGPAFRKLEVVFEAMKVSYTRELGREFLKTLDFIKKVFVK